MSRILYRIGHFAGRHPWRVLAAWVLVAVTAFMLNSSLGGPPDESFTIPGAESQRAADAIEDRFPQETLYTLQRHLPRRRGHHRSGSQGGGRAGASPSSPRATHVVGVSDPYDPQASTVSKDGTTAFATVAFDREVIGVEQFDAAEHATAGGP